MDSQHKRKHLAQTRYSRLVSARLPIALADRMKAHMAYTGHTTTTLVTQAVTEYLANHSPIEAGREEAGA